MKTKSAGSTNFSGTMPERLIGVSEPRMPEKDRYGTLIDFLKILISLSSAILVVAAGLYADQSKIPLGWPKYVLLAAAASVLSNLILSLLAMGTINNLIMNDAWLRQTEKTSLYIRIHRYSNWAYRSFGLFAIFVFGFFLLRTFMVPTPSVATISWC
jgi:hypothetical protein